MLSFLPTPAFEAEIQTNPWLGRKRLLHHHTRPCPDARGGATPGSAPDVRARQKAANQRHPFKIGTGLAGERKRGGSCLIFMDQVISSKMRGGCSGTSPRPLATPLVGHDSNTLRNAVLSGRPHQRICRWESRLVHQQRPLGTMQPKAFPARVRSFAAATQGRRKVSSPQQGWFSTWTAPGRELSCQQDTSWCKEEELSVCSPQVRRVEP